MSDASTPRTDEFQSRIASSGSTHGAYELCLDHARQLERSLAASQQRCAELEKAGTNLMARINELYPMRFREIFEVGGAAHTDFEDAWIMMHRALTKEPR